MMRKMYLGLLTATLFLNFSCESDNEDVIAAYTVPETYNFEPADYATATQAVHMWDGFQKYLGRSKDRMLSLDTVNYLWNNTNNAFTTENVSNLSSTPAQLNSATSVKLSALTTHASAIKFFADSMVAISQYYSTAGAEGKAGKQGGRLFNYAGFEFNQGVAKGLMGNFQLKKIFEHLDRSTTADNGTVVTGSGTAMQHEWDMAFGYMGIPKDYDTTAAIAASSNLNKPLAIGHYFRERGKYINSGRTVFEAFRKGRAAIGAKDYAVRNEAITTIKDYVERTIAAALYFYVTKPQSGTEIASRLHELSEGYGFVVALKQRPSTSKLSAANYQKLLDILNTNFYALLNETAAAGAKTKLQMAQEVLITAYGQLQP